MRPHLTAGALGAMVLAIVPFVLSSRPSQEADDVVPAQQAENADLLETMQGGWVLVEMTAPNLSTTGRQEIAYLLVAKEFMSLELHVGFFGQNEGQLNGFTQTGTYRISFDEFGNLRAMTLIGSFHEFEGFAEPEPPGLERSYHVDVDETTLTLSREDGTRFKFSRLATGKARVDFWGRPIEPESSTEKKEGGEGGDRGEDQGGGAGGE